MDRKIKLKQAASKRHNKKSKGQNFDLFQENKNKLSTKNSTKNKVICPKNAMATTQSPVTASVAANSAVALVTLTAMPGREKWGGEFEFLLSLLGYSVGLGNVWRFPYLCYNNGGGAFLIPFTVMLIIAGLPLMFMELGFGQYAGLGPVAIYFRFCPLACGLGIGMVIVSLIVMLYYNMIMSWTIHFFFASLRPILPWKNCDPEWSTKFCYSYETASICEANNGTFYLQNCYNDTDVEALNLTDLVANVIRKPPAEEYFNNYVLRLSSGIEETGGISIPLAICLFIAWAIVFLCLCKGVKSSGKVVYFTALFPYVVLVILFIRGVTLPGAYNGIQYYLTPDFKQLANAQVWGDAAVQIFFALSPSWGGLITLSSYNKFSNNCYKDALIVAVCNIVTSFFAGLVIFALIGFLAHVLRVEIQKVVAQGAGLAFIVYPEVVAKLPGATIWAVLFFFMLLTLGLDSQFALMETVTTAILDNFPKLRPYKTWVVLLVSIFGYLGGLIFTTRSGMYWLQLMDKYAANWSVLLIAIFECMLIAWVYGSQRFLNDIQGMIGKRSYFWNIFWSTMWRFVTPAALLFILFFNWFEYKPASYGTYVYPLWADAIGWIVGLLPVAVILAIAVHQYCTAPKHLKLKQRIKYLLTPTPEWGPAGHPCVGFNDGKYQNRNNDDNMNSQSLINDMPTLAITNGDNTNICSGNRKDSICLRERIKAKVNLDIAADIAFDFNNKTDERLKTDKSECMPMQSFSGSSCGKDNKSKTAADISTSKQPLIEDEQIKDLFIGPGNQNPKITKVSATIVNPNQVTIIDSNIRVTLFTTATTINQFAAGKPSNSIMTTFTVPETKLIATPNIKRTSSERFNQNSGLKAVATTSTNVSAVSGTNFSIKNSAIPISSTFSKSALLYSPNVSILQPIKLNTATKVTATQIQPLTAHFEKPTTFSTTLSSEKFKEATTLQNSSANPKPPIVTNNNVNIPSESVVSSSSAPVTKPSKTRESNF